MMTPWAQARPDELSGIRGVCLDIDDTFSSHGKITSQAFNALWDLKNAGFAIVPVTGRPAGWCDHIARFWPVDAVVGENGAFTFYMADGIRRRTETPGASSNPKPKIQALANVILQEFPKARWASDQDYREHDLAIDISEDVPAWSESEIDRLLALCEAQGAIAKLSSVHVNAWYGDYNKRRGLTHALTTLPALKGPLSDPDQWIYIGDSPNDEPLFEWFKNSVGVANLKPYIPRLKFPPRWITASESGKGFAEMAAKLCEKKRV